MQAWERKEIFDAIEKTSTLPAVTAGDSMSYTLTELPSIAELLARIEKLEEELANISTN